MDRMAERSIHVLLVEDNPGDARLIRRMLADATAGGPDSPPFDVTCVDTLAGGVRSVHAGKSDVILLDLSLPDSQGLSTLARMQAAAPAVPVVILTGLADESAALAAVQNGAQDYLVKGHVDPNALSNSIRYARERKQLLEALREVLGKPGGAQRRAGRVRPHRRPRPQEPGLHGRRQCRAAARQAGAARAGGAGGDAARHPALGTEDVAGNPGAAAPLAGTPLRRCHRRRSTCRSCWPRRRPVSGRCWRKRAAS